MFGYVYVHQYNLCVFLKNFSNGNLCTINVVIKIIIGTGLLLPCHVFWLGKCLALIVLFLDIIIQLCKSKILVH